MIELLNVYYKDGETRTTADVHYGNELEQMGYRRKPVNSLHDALIFIAGYEAARKEHENGGV